METTFVLDALEQALWPVGRPAQSITVIKVLSMYRWPTRSGLRKPDYWHQAGSTGDLYDNAMAESINGLYKAEVIHRKSWKNRTEVELATLTWVAGITIDNCWKGWAIFLRQEAKKAYYASIGNNNLAA